MRKGVLFSVILCLLLSCSLPFNIDSLLERSRAKDTENTQPQPTAPLATTEPTSIDLLPIQTAEVVSSQPGQPAEVAYANLIDLINKNDITITRFQGSLENAGFIGIPLELEIRNNTGEDIEIEFPCGLIFVPERSTTQQMMLIQPLYFSIPAGGSLLKQPFVVCIDSDRGIPTPEDSFTVGVLAEDELLQLAGCLCAEQLVAGGDFNQLLGIQHATWAVAGGFDEDNPLPWDAMEDLMEQMGEDTELSETLREMMTGVLPAASEWLDKCNITIQDK